ncbi:hypothetical protein Pyn_07592 [Prunus yedoensis var. nudiflora]|uniref:Uncharacterized protein n=1 Tax=Prunus yedoensis var. nudiflora TaxID=2094558 RepID=A0A314XHZ2_PRUYE|nr:hypothetical protein Pyn_07592 [Prunus yedoensis var. nudiflora]
MISNVLATSPFCICIEMKLSTASSSVFCLTSIKKLFSLLIVFLPPVLHYLRGSNNNRQFCHSTYGAGQALPQAEFSLPFWFLRPSPAGAQNRAKGSPVKPNRPPAQPQARASGGSHQSGQAHGQILLGLQPEGADWQPLPCLALALTFMGGLAVSVCGEASRD